MRTFLVVWAGQLVSVTGTALTGFGLQVWIYLETGSVTRLALVSLAYALPAVLLSPFAGVLADRLDRRLAMLGRRRPGRPLHPGHRRRSTSPARWRCGTSTC